MQRTGMSDNRESGGWRRVVVEKPFGTDLPSSKELNDLVDDVFTAPLHGFRGTVDYWTRASAKPRLADIRLQRTRYAGSPSFFVVE